MRRELIMTCFAVGAILAPAAAYAVDSDTDRAHAGSFVKDSVITTKIKSKLASEHLGSVKHISVDTDKDGVVWMTGTVNSREEADRAVTIARNTEGVRSVKNELKVQPDR